MLEVYLLRWRGIYDAADAFGFGEADGVIDGAERNFELHHDGVGFAEQRSGGIDVFGGERIVRAFDDDDAVLATGLDKDWCDAAGDSFRDADMAGVNALRLEIFDGSGTEEVAADFGDHGDIRPAEACGDGLVGAFAAKAQVEFFAEDGFAWAGEDVVKGGEVNVGAAYYGDEGLFGHVADYSCVRALWECFLKWKVRLTQRSQRAQRREERKCGLTGWMAAHISTDGAEALDSMRGTCCEGVL